MPDDTQDLEYGQPLSDDELVAYFWTCYRASREWFDPIWEEFETLSEAYGGETLDEKDRLWIIETKRAPISFNMMASTIDTIVGSDQSDRKEVVFRGADMGHFDGIKGEWLTAALRTQMAKCHGHRQQSDTFYDDLIGGYGFSEVFLDTSKIPIPVVTEHVPPWEMWPDPDATQDCLADARFMIRGRQWLVEEVQARWPRKAKDVAAGLATETIPVTSPKPSVAGKWKEVSSPARRQGVMVYDFCYRRYEPRVVYDEEGQMVSVRPKEFRESQKAGEEALAAAVAQWEAMGGPASQSPPPEPGEYVIDEYYEHAAESFYRAYILGDGEAGTGLVLEHKPLNINRMPYQALTAYKKKVVSERRVQFFGPARKVYDAQLYLNKSLGVYLDILARGAKGGGFISKDLLKHGEDDFIKNMSIPGWWEIVDGEDIGDDKIRFKPVQGTPTGYENFLNLCMDAMSRISLVTDWVKGTAMQERSNVLISNLQQQSMTGLNPLFDPLAQYRETVGTMMAEVMLKHFSNDQLNQLIGDVEPVIGLTHEEVEGPEGMDLTPIMIPDERGGERPITPADILREVNPFDYDIAVDVGQASVNQKQAVWQIFVQTGLLQQLLELLGPAMQPLIPQLIRYLPLPSTMAKKLADDLEAEMASQQELRTDEGIVEALAKMPPERQLALLEAAAGSQGQGPM